MEKIVLEQQQQQAVIFGKGEIGQEAVVRKLLTRSRPHKPSQTAWRLILIMGDGGLLVAVFALILLLLPYLHLEPQLSWSALGVRNSLLVWGSLALVAWGIAASIMQAQYLANAVSRLKSPLVASFALLLMVFFTAVFTYPFVIDAFTSYLKVSLLFFVLAFPAFCVWRIAFAGVMGLARFQRLAVIVGMSTAREAIAEELRNARRPGATILGYIGDSIEERVEQVELPRGKLPILGGRSTLRYLVRNKIIDMIIMTTDYKENPALFQEAIEAVQHGISVVPMTLMYEYASGKIPVEYVGDHWFVTLSAERLVSPLYLCWSNIMNLTFGFCGLLFFCLLLPVLALLIYLDSPGPIFYSQERLGYRGQKFYIHKFRSMCIDAEKKGYAIWAAENDTRVTRIGRFMRATHLDELPQVLNILRGEMSLIGPRPERAVFVYELEKTIPFYRCRLAVKPGLTGWAQVKYRYGSTGNDALVKLQYDLYYIKHRSFMLDLFIILKTVLEVLFCRGR